MMYLSLPLDGYPVLKQGASGVAVKVLQRRLNQRLAEFQAMMPFVKVNGVFDQQLLKTVKYLQCITFLPVDGVVDLQTWDFLFEGIPSLPILAPGSYGAMVWQVQDTLSRLGVNTDVNGIFNQRLWQHIQDYQRMNDLLPRGVIDRLTWSCLIQERVKTPRWFMRCLVSS